MDESQVRNLIQSTFHNGTCRFLLEQELSMIMEAGDSLVLKNLRREARFVFQPNWDNFSGQHILGLPDLKFETWQDACVSFHLYLRSLHDDGSTLAQFRRRTAQVWFWLFFDMYCEESRRTHGVTGTTGRYNLESMTDIQHQILLKAYPGSTWGKACRKSLCDDLQYGFNWWRLACCLGHGVILIASNEVARFLEICLYNEALVDALINYVQNAYPEALGLFHLCSPVVDSFMCGKSPRPGDIIRVQKCIALVVKRGPLIRSYCLPWKWSYPGPLAMANAISFLMGCEIEGALSIARVLG
ncbi:hypothetical protein BDV11DRAFT_169148 [Aspergillus similis]